nr:immunoglobulin heavy chain junction region [Mus musculus]NSM06755.1 immunoglobulin heavy chain junction region [Mus musculus]
CARSSYGHWYFDVW